MKKITLLLLTCILVSSCATDKAPIAFSVVEIPSDFESNITANYHKANPKSAAGDSINKHIERTIIELVGMDSIHEDIPTALKAFDNRYIGFKKDFPDSDLPPWELDIETEVLHQTEGVITIGISLYEYQGGAHGNSQIRLLNLDPVSGNNLSTEAIIKDIKAFETLAKTYFLNHLEQREEALTIEDYFFGEPFHLPENMGFSEDGFILLYNVYEVASYAQGFTEFAIPYEDLDGLLKILPY